MKKLFTLVLALVSVAAFAADTRIYCKMTHGWWTADGAAEKYSGLPYSALQQPENDR